MRSLLSDVRFALRLLRRSPGFYATLLAVLVAGIGATTAMFSIVESLLLKPLPYPHPEQLTMVWTSDPAGPKQNSSLPDFLDWKAQATTFERLAAIDYAPLSLSSAGGKPEHVRAADVSGEFFSVFGLPALRGRLLGPEDDRVGGPRVAVLSASLWQRRFGSDPTLLGRTIDLDGEPYAVVGIAPEGFRFAGPKGTGADVWVPLSVWRGDYAKLAISGRGSHFMQVVGRRGAGVTLEQAQAQMSGIARQLEIAHPVENSNRGVLLQDLHEALVGSSRAGVWVLFVAVLLVFVAVCANVAGLLLTRAQSRRAEMAVRAALGASPTRLARQVLTETVVLFVQGSAGGSLIAGWLVHLFVAGVLDADRAALSTIDVRVDGFALLFSIVACFACGIVFGLAPALFVSHTAPQAVLKESAARASVGRTQRAVRAGLVVAQVALACALLVGSGLALQAFARAASIPPGFDPQQVATVRIELPERKYADDERIAAFYRDVMAKVAARPGVDSVAGDSLIPMGNMDWFVSFLIEGRPPWPPREDPALAYHAVTPGYFRTMRIPLLRGRDFVDRDKKGGRPVVIVSQATAERYFPGQDAVGKRIALGDDERWLEIVGVVGDVRRHSGAHALVEESYVPFAQNPANWMFLVARSPRAEALLQEIPGIVASVDPEQSVSGQLLMSERVAESISRQRDEALLLASFAGAALLLSFLGVFGLVSYATSQRSRELGIRLALGASPQGVVGLVMKGGLRLVAAGLAIGLAGAALVGRILAERMAGVHAFDLAVYAGIAALLGAAGLVASLLPAWRAVRIPPASALRYE